MSGTYTITFRLYDIASLGTALDTDSHSVEVTDGLFNTNIDFDQEYFDGRELWLGITIGIDSEMMPRHELSAVPYALSLKPGAVINGSVSGPILKVSTTSDNSEGFWIDTSGKESEGFVAKTTGYNSDCFYAKTTGDNSDSFRAFTSGDGSGGVRVSTSGNYSVGVSASTDGDNSYGVIARTTGDSSYGVHAHSTKSNGISAETGRTDHKYGVTTPDKMCAMSYDTGCNDVAEYFPVTEDVEPGTVLVIGEDSKLQTSGKAYDTTVAGIVSTAPGVALGTNDSGNAGEKLIAVAGRVPCKVDATYAPIMPGDLLTTSDTRGHAMKATNPQIGTILGKALEPLDSGTGVIEVLVTLQ